jgi:2-succinyl-6-hydroxy-2,4-cyclohexadiene-1-carboxylate synthase
LIQTTKQTDERREAGTMECWCLHGAVGMAADFRALSKHLATAKIGSHAVDLWRFLESGPLPLSGFGPALNADAAGRVFRGDSRILLGYSMGGRLALHSLLDHKHPWRAAVMVSTHPGLEDAAERGARRASDAAWAARAITSNWKDFLAEWNAQGILDGTVPRDPGTESAMLTRRGEIARSFVDWSLGAQDPLWDRLPEITVPVLWIAGENDLKFRALAERAVERIPHASLAIAPGAGHRVPWSAPDWFAREVTAFTRHGGADGQ